MIYLFYNWQCVPLNSFHIFHAYTHFSPIQWPLVVSLCLSVCFCFVIFVLQIPHICIKTFSLFVSLGLISISIIPSGSIHVVLNDKILFFYSNISLFISTLIYLSSRSSLSIHLWYEWTQRCPQYLDYCKQCFCEHWGAYIFLN